VRIKLVDIGPIRSADIELTPLTVFVGLNNAGKSFAATVIYAALSSSQIRQPASTVRSHRTVDAQLRHLRSTLALFEFIQDNKETKTLAELPGIPPNLRQVLEEQIDQDFEDYREGIAAALTRATGVPELGQLRRHQHQKRATRGQLTIECQDPDLVIEVKIGPAKPKITISKPDFEDAWKQLWASEQLLSPRQGNPMHLSLEFTPEALTRACFKEFPVHVSYLPAARSGLMQSHRVLVESLIRRSSLAGLEDMRVPAMSGVIADFLGEMVAGDPDRRGDFQDEADQLERDILGGTIELERLPSGIQSEFVYRSPAGDFPLRRTSSMVAELAPIAIYLRQILRVGDLLIIEEPEAHLHPSNQVLLAQLLVRLVRSGKLKVIVTTHSEFFLQQLNNSLVAGNLNEPAAASASYAKDLRLTPSAAAAYHFEVTPTGTNVSRLDITPREGIVETSFDKVTEDLYNESVALDRQLDAETE